MKLQSSEILSDSEGYNTSPYHNSIPVLPKAQIKQNYVQDKEYKIRQISPTQFEVLGSPLSRAIEDDWPRALLCTGLDTSRKGERMLETLKHYGLFVLHNMLSVLNKTARQLGQMFPEKPPQPIIEIEDDPNEVEDTYDEVDDSMIMNNEVDKVRRNRWGLPTLEEE